MLPFPSLHAGSGSRFSSVGGLGEPVQMAVFGAEIAMLLEEKLKWCCF